MNDDTRPLNLDRESQIEYELQKGNYKKKIENRENGITVFKDNQSFFIPNKYINKIISGEKSFDPDTDTLILAWYILNKKSLDRIEDVKSKLCLEYGENGTRLEKLLLIKCGNTIHQKLQIGLMIAAIPLKYYSKDLKKRSYPLFRDRLDLYYVFQDFQNAYDLIKSINVELVYGKHSQKFYEDILAVAKPSEENVYKFNDLFLDFYIERFGYKNTFKTMLTLKGFKQEDKEIAEKMKTITPDLFTEEEDCFILEKEKVKATYHFHKGFKETPFLELEGIPENIEKIFNETINILDYE